MKKIYFCLFILFVVSAGIRAQSPVLLKDIINGSVGGFTTAGQFGYYYIPLNVVWKHNGEIFFTANNSAQSPGGSYTNDIELWKSDGTDAGTVMVKDIYPGTGNGSDPQDFREINGILYFTAYSPSSGRELWKTDGSSGGTVMVKDIIPGNVGGFSTSGQFGYYDYTFSVVWQTGNTFYFTANNAALNPGGSYTNDIELWKSDGTDAGTVMVKDIYPGNTNGSYPQDFRDINGTLFFTARNSSSGRELWKTDGSTGGTVIVKEIISGNVGGFETAGQFGYYDYTFSVVWQTGNTFYFKANGAALNPTGSYTNDIELWKSDGTDAGTVLVKDIYPGNTNGSEPQDFKEINGTLYFTARNASSGRELWKTDGSTGGTVIVKEIISGNVGGFETAGQFGYYDYTFSVVWQTGNTFYFKANGAALNPTGSYTNDIELWKSDGTDAGTVLVKDIYPGNTNGSEPQDFREINGTLFFTARNASSGRELWKTDGSTAGTVIVKEIINGNVGGFETAGQFGYYDYTFNVVWQTGNTFYFTANGAALNPTGSYTNDIELWKSDGTDAGTVIVKDIYPGNTNGSDPQDFKSINGTLYFTAYNASSGRELWKTDGTTNGTVLVKEIIPGNVGGFETAGQFGYYTWTFNSPFSVGNDFYFTANDNAFAPGGSYTNDIELWKSNGTDAGTTKVMDIYPGLTTGSDPADFALALGKVFFTATDANHGREIWTIDNATPTSITEPVAINGLQLYPNPTNDNLNIVLTSTENASVATSFLLTDLNGRLVYKEEVTVSGSPFFHRLDLSSLEPGMYLLNIKNNRVNEVRKIIRQ